MKKIVSLIIALIMISAALSCALPAFSEAADPVDVAPDRWSYASVKYALNNNYMNGVGGGRFDPAGSLTRAMVATVLWRRQGEPKPSAASGFTDVPAGQWFTDAVAWAKETGIVKGITDKKFVPEGLITREQLATMLYRFAVSLDLPVGEASDLSSF
ncbi:MAG: S-layer homology domain-containing protein, partial [Clostridia bacterium]|nr:S-layer homology domain-containing protein [Clostridia bacterium]